MSAAQEAATPKPEPVVLREDCLNYTPTAGSVSLARHRAARLVTEWGRAELAWSVGLTVSELATNALLHACARNQLFQVRIALRPGSLRVEVSDPHGERLPSPRAADEDECFGRGLLIVAQLADRWGTEPRTVGKTVFAEFAVGAGGTRSTGGAGGTGSTGGTGGADRTYGTDAGPPPPCAGASA
ncbi:ATP-binding protein [Streptomyces sp. NPDC059479]|uniref:ATP-binding protein n=1 Tax=Streptomyces sp. NPDC059479 TaxID=3346848 RepID=UPI0036A848AB